MWCPENPAEAAALSTAVVHATHSFACLLSLADMVRLPSLLEGMQMNNECGSLEACETQGLRGTSDPTFSVELRGFW